MKELTRPAGWPFLQASILITKSDILRRDQKWFVDEDYHESETTSSYAPSEESENSEMEDVSECEASEETDYVLLEKISQDVDDMELDEISADAAMGWPEPWWTETERARLEKEELDRQIDQLVEEEGKAAAAYNPDEIVASITEFYELIVQMGHWPESSIHYPPHNDPAINVDLAVELGYDPAVIQLMQKLPYISSRYLDLIIDETRLADYRDEKHLRDGRRPYPKMHQDGCPDIDHWMLPLTNPNRYGFMLILDTRLGAMRAYEALQGPPIWTVEQRRNPGWEERRWSDIFNWTDYRRTPLVPANVYWRTIIDAYRSLKCLPIIEPQRSYTKLDYTNSHLHKDSDEQQARKIARARENQTKLEEEQGNLLRLYRECGWPDQWRREEFVQILKAQKERPRPLVSKGVIPRRKKAMEEAQERADLVDPTRQEGSDV